MTGMRENPSREGIRGGEASYPRQATPGRAAPNPLVSVRYWRWARGGGRVPRLTRDAVPKLRASSSNSGHGVLPMLAIHRPSACFSHLPFPRWSLVCHAVSLEPARLGQTQPGLENGRGPRRSRW